MNKYYIASFAFLFFSHTLFGQIDHWETVIYSSNVWKYRPGTSNPPANWKSLSFNDSNWQSGIGGIGYGDGDDNTNITPVASLYLRRKFQIIDPEKIKMALLHADYDDAFVAYLNGVEIARSNILGNPPAYNTNPLDWHEATMYSGGLPEPFLISETALEELSFGTENILAIQVHNYQGASSSDLSSNFFLSLAITDDGNYYGPTPSWFWPPFESTHLPILTINTNGEYIPDEPSIPGEMGIIWNGEGQANNWTDPPNEFLGNISIERRGQSSLYLFPKNGFAIETKDENGEDMDVSFLNFPEEEDWILHGPYSDKTLMRNVLVMEMARRMGQYASRTRFVELYINGQYEGIYVIMERIKRDKNRVDIANLREDDLSGDQLTGGYVFKVDKDEADWFSSFDMQNIPGAKLPFQYVSPRRSKIKPPQAAYIQAYVDSFEQAIRSPNLTFGGKRYDEYIDLTSFADNFIINELSKNVDAFRLSSYFHKDKDSKGGKIVAGPVWDYNLAFGNGDYCNASDPTGWIRYTPCGDPNPFWWERMIQDPVFTNLLKCRWNQFRQGHLHVDSLHAFIDQQAEYLGPALDRNFDRWPVLGEYIWPNAVVTGSYEGEIAFMKNFLQNRLLWMDANIYGNCFPTASYAVEEGVPIFIKPNPSSGIIYLTVNSKSPAGVDMVVQNVFGEQLQFFSFHPPLENYPVNLGDLDNGIYFLTFTEGGKTQTKRLIISK